MLMLNEEARKRFLGESANATRRQEDKAARFIALACRTRL